MRLFRGFTLIELLVIIAIMGTMVMVGVVSFTSGRASMSQFAAARDVMAVVRRARSTALVTQQPVVVTFSNEKVDDVACAKVEIASKKFFSSSKSSKQVVNLAGYPIENEQGDEATEASAPSEAVVDPGAEAPVNKEEGETLEDVLAPTKIDDAVMMGLKIKVLEEDETLVIPESETRRSKISIFSTAGAVARSYEAKSSSDSSAKAAQGKTEVDLATEQPVQIVFNANGTVKPPHKIWIYPEETTPDKGLCIEVDRYGEPKCEDVEGQ